MHPSDPRRPTWSLLQPTFVLSEVGGERISMRSCLTLGSQSPSHSYRCGWRLRGEPAQRRPMPPRGPQGHLQMLVEVVRRACTTQTHAIAWPTRPLPAHKFSNLGRDCGEGLHNAALCNHMAHKAVSKC